jgi:hypothetical protein
MFNIPIYVCIGYGMLPVSFLIYFDILLVVRFGYCFPYAVRGIGGGGG